MICSHLTEQQKLCRCGAGGDSGQSVKYHGSFPEISVVVKRLPCSSLSTADRRHRTVVPPLLPIVSIGECDTRSSKVVSLPAQRKVPWRVLLPSNDQLKYIPFIPLPGHLGGGGLILPALSRVNVSVPVILPSIPQHRYEKHAHRMLIIRRRKIKKHWRKKRRKRDYVQYLKWHQQQKQRKEDAFRQRMNVMLSEALGFDADAYVRAAVAKAKWRPADNHFPDGRRKFPHWTELMTVEELFQLPETDYIDKQSCLAEGEDWEAIKKLRQEYYAKGYGVKTPNDDGSNFGSTSKPA
ncbi:unnamed protein product [Soboliphyme baturini]|uniref:DUF1713 domain-containing protein n=1 Tax=Soboliphyme baturini TaxID=241478 RepID=A0A183IS83_9BILA|nr:unnamed protein product [Soboliphyme baturini]